MRRLLLVLFLLPLALLADNFRLYMTDGTWHQVSEYKVEQDRVHFYSTERSEWEEMPLSLIDLKRTEAERKSSLDAAKKEAAAEDAEEKFDRAQAHTISLIPMNAGVYYLEGEQVRTLKQAESKIVNNKRRSVLKAMSPIPLVPGKATIELDGEHSAFTVRDDRPALWYRPSEYERFAIVRCLPKSDARIIEKWSIVPVSKEIVAERDMVETFRQQMGNDLYKVWPQKPLAPGEYAFIQFTEGAGNTQTWDFRVEAPAKQ